MVSKLLTLHAMRLLQFVLVLVWLVICHLWLFSFVQLLDYWWDGWLLGLLLSSFRLDLRLRLWFFDLRLDNRLNFSHLWGYDHRWLLKRRQHSHHAELGETYWLVKNRFWIECLLQNFMNLFVSDGNSVHTLNWGIRRFKDQFELVSRCSSWAERKRLPEDLAF